MLAVIRRHSLSIALVAALLALLGFLLAVGPTVYRVDHELGPAEPLPTGPYWLWWTFELAMSIIADVFGPLLLVLLTKHLWETKTPEAKDPPEER